MSLNQQNFDGRVFATSPHQINYNIQGPNMVNPHRLNVPPQHFIVHHQQFPIQVIPIQSTVTNMAVNSPPHIVQNLVAPQTQNLTVFQQK